MSRDVSGLLVLATCLAVSLRPRARSHLRPAPEQGRDLSPMDGAGDKGGRGGNWTTVAPPPPFVSPHRQRLELRSQPETTEQT